MLLPTLDKVRQPSTEARQFVYSDELAEVVRKGSFLDTHSLESRERFFINEVASYFAILGTFRSMGIVDADLAAGWAGAKFTWNVLTVEHRSATKSLPVIAETNTTGHRRALVLR